MTVGEQNGVLPEPHLGALMIVWHQWPLKTPPRSLNTWVLHQLVRHAWPDEAPWIRGESSLQTYYYIKSSCFRFSCPRITMTRTNENIHRQYIPFCCCLIGDLCQTDFVNPVQIWREGKDKGHVYTLWIFPLLMITPPTHTMLSAVLYFSSLSLEIKVLRFKEDILYSFWGLWLRFWNPMEQLDTTDQRVKSADLQKIVTRALCLPSVFWILSKRSA